jgi:hypothetical protein
LRSNAAAAPEYGGDETVDCVPTQQPGGEKIGRAASGLPAAVWSSAAANPVKIGMHAVASALPATTLNNRSGSLNAAATSSS